MAKTLIWATNSHLMHIDRTTELKTTVQVRLVSGTYLMSIRRSSQMMLMTRQGKSTIIGVIKAIIEVEINTTEAIMTIKTIHPVRLSKNSRHLPHHSAKIFSLQISRLRPHRTRSRKRPQSQTRVQRNRTSSSRREYQEVSTPASSSSLKSKWSIVHSWHIRIRLTKTWFCSSSSTKKLQRTCRPRIRIMLATSIDSLKLLLPKSHWSNWRRRT